MKSRILYTKPSITEREVELAEDAARHGWGERCYEYIDAFESGFRSYLGVDFAIATSSCTGALHMGLAALGIGQGDEVILADTNWIATAAPIVHLGAKPIFVDVRPDTWCIDPEQVARKITQRTKAIIATHIYGNLCEMDELLQIGEAYGIPIIEDAAEAIGSQYRGRPAGTLGLFGTFSFHGTKTITTGEGGIFVTNSGDLFRKVQTLSNHGRSPGQTKQFWPDVVGFKYKMSNIQAAIGVAQLERVDELVTRRRDILYSYKQKLLHCKSVALNPEPQHVINGAWMPTVIFSAKSGATREKAIAAFKAENIDARVFFYPLSQLPMFDDTLDNPVAYELAERGFNLPSYHDLSDVEIDRVVDVVRMLAGEG
ncbi:MAG TPA: DegT/DnrJ/EryC1/StrS family aminotransferase [Microvirga sp.]|jgi:perosamine synthetase|nr:DegT/DnrJ/EryC1/StrS family aminotransferase [Microvirga sp.]